MVCYYEHSLLLNIVILKGFGLQEEIPLEFFIFPDIFLLLKDHFEYLKAFKVTIGTKCVLQHFLLIKGKICTQHQIKASKCYLEAFLDFFLDPLINLRENHLHHMPSLLVGFKDHHILFRSFLKVRQYLIDEGRIEQLLHHLCHSLLGFFVEIAVANEVEIVSIEDLLVFLHFEYLGNSEAIFLFLL